MSCHNQSCYLGSFTLLLLSNYILSLISFFSWQWGVPGACVISFHVLALPGGLARL